MSEIKINQDARRKAMEAFVNNWTAADRTAVHAFDAALEAYERAKAEQKPPENMRDTLIYAVTGWPHHRDAELVDAILDVLSHPSPGVVEAMEDCCADMTKISITELTRRKWQAGVQAIKEGK